MNDDLVLFEIFFFLSNEPCNFFFLAFLNVSKERVPELEC